MIEVTDVTKFYGPIKAVDSLSFRLERGEVLGFLGPNGAGKTTTMKILTCYMPPTTGRATVKGKDVFRDALEVRSLIGYLPENAPLYHDMTAREYLRFIAEMRQIDTRDIVRRIKHVTRTCGLDGVLDRMIGTLSKGYRQRVGLAQAMIHDPEILILDEPTSGLDPNQIVEMRNLIKEIGKRKTVILSTHNLSEVQASATRVLIIHRGKIVTDASTDQIQKTRGRNRYEVVLAAEDGSREELRKALRGIDEVEKVDAIDVKEEDVWSFEILGKTDADLRRPIFKFAVDGGHTLLELKPEKASLESVFMELTRE
ncbi:MAG: ATP-binding cassette domain-containing protein [Deltaproteobacteria bacterium]|nr:ATP-binding cassette domain-containing protein [Deltaproteobacteria bacterium]